MYLLNQIMTVFFQHHFNETFPKLNLPYKFWRNFNNTKKTWQATIVNNNTSVMDFFALLFDNAELFREKTSGISPNVLASRPSFFFSDDGHKKCDNHQETRKSYQKFCNQVIVLYLYSQLVISFFKNRGQFVWQLGWQEWRNYARWHNWQLQFWRFWIEPFSKQWVFVFYKSFISLDCPFDVITPPSSSRALALSELASYPYPRLALCRAVIFVQK